MCHQPQSVDPDTGNTVDFPVLIHKIHRGAGLPSVVAGGVYEIIGYNGSVHDYSTVQFPQDVRNCTKCHTEAVDDAGAPLAPQSAVWKERPSRAGCGSCHDDVDFAEGVNHFVQPNDALCANCHGVQGFLPVEDVHVLPEASGPGLVLGILPVDSTTDIAGDGSLTITITASWGDGTPVTDLTGLDRVAATLAYPVREYAARISETVQGGGRVGDWPTIRATWASMSTPSPPA